jgi:hypothetical protein
MIRVLLVLLKLLVPIPRIFEIPYKSKRGAVKIVIYSTEFNLAGGESAEQTKGTRAKCLVYPPQTLKRMANAFAYRGRVKAKNAFAQRAGISKHITAVNHKTYNCKITNFIAQNNKLQVKNNNLQV